jgi:hypothetical protein
MRNVAVGTKKINQEAGMKHTLVHSGLVTAVLCIAGMLPVQAQAAQCSLASVAGAWAYTYTGTIFVPNPLPVAAAGQARLDSQGNLKGSQTHTIAGQTEVEDISGAYTVNKNCTGTFAVSVYLNGQLLRAANLNVAYNSNINHARMIFTSLTLPDGTVLPAVITADVNRVFSDN